MGAGSDVQGIFIDRLVYERVGESYQPPRFCRGIKGGRRDQNDSTNSRDMGYVNLVEKLNPVMEGDAEQ